MTICGSCALAGVPARSGIALLDDLAAELWWFARSMFLCAGCDAALPSLRFQPADSPDVVTTATASPRLVFGFRADTPMRRWAERHSAMVAMPAAAVTARLGDKTYLPELARQAGVTVPRSVVRRSAAPGDAEALWRELAAERAVAQLAANDLTGVGTCRVDGVDALAGCLRRWTGLDVKLAEYVDGMPLTISGVVTAGDVMVSGISYQLVGYERITPVWGAHCGNQLTGDTDLPPGVAAACREAGRRVGTAIARAGFRGMFGMDVLATATEIVVLELNPRIQSVTSLLNAAEYAAGLLPSPIVHALTFASGASLPVTEAGGALPPLGQLVVSSMTTGRVSALPLAGVWRLTELAPPRCVPHGPSVPLAGLGPGQALIWPLTQPGGRVGQADRLFVMQTSEPVITLQDGALTEHATRWLEALSGHVRVEGATE